MTRNLLFLTSLLLAGCVEETRSITVYPLSGYRGHRKAEAAETFTAVVERQEVVRHWTGGVESLVQRGFTCAVQDERTFQCSIASGLETYRMENGDLEHHPVDQLIYVPWLVWASFKYDLPELRGIHHELAKVNPVWVWIWVAIAAIVFLGFLGFVFVDANLTGDAPRRTRPEPPPRSPWDDLAREAEDGKGNRVPKPAPRVALWLKVGLAPVAAFAVFVLLCALPSPAHPPTSPHAHTSPHAPAPAVCGNLPTVTNNPFMIFTSATCAEGHAMCGARRGWNCDGTATCADGSKPTYLCHSDGKRRPADERLVVFPSVHPDH